MEAYDLLAEALEKQGRPTQAQQILEKAAEHSPNALLRHKHLAVLASSNQDMPTASKAWRQTVSLGTYSIHDNSEHYLALGQSLSDLSEGDSSNEGTAHADEALTILRRMEKRFAGQENIKLRSRIVQSRVHAGQDRMNEAQNALDSVADELDPDLMPPEACLDYAKTLFRLGREADAKGLLNALALRCSDNPPLLQKIESLLDEPVGFRQKLQARSLNREGIKAFEAGNLEEAVTTFNRALDIVPSHASLNLNLVQVLMKQYQGTAGDRELLKRCEKCLEKLADLPEQHRQHRRLISLRKKLEGMMS
jgi:tetratricopeptide (TPR) repeat protein